MDQVTAYIESRREHFLTELRDLLRFPSVKGETAALGAAALWVADRLGKLGADVQLLPTGGLAVVFGELGQGERTLMSYSHYDVQPPDPLELWQSPPFWAQVRDGKLYARGVSDDKGDTVARLQAVEVYRAVYGELPLRLKFFVEGEEEVGSPHLAPLAERHRDLLRADGVLWEAGGYDELDRYTFYCGLKGIQYLELRVGGANTELHSSLAAYVPNPAWRLVHALGTLKDAQENITIDGFMEHVRPPSQADLELISRIPFAGPEMKAAWGIPAFVNGSSDSEALLRFLTQPTCTICGLRSGYLGEGEKTVLPNSALVKLDFRLVADLTPALVLSLLRAHLDRRGFSDVEIVPAASTDVARSDVTSPLVQAAVAAARTIYGHEPVVYPTHGGSGPMYALVQALGTNGVMAGVGYAGSRAHAPNENIRLEDYFRHIAFLVQFMRVFAHPAGSDLPIPEVEAGAPGNAEASQITYPPHAPVASATMPALPALIKGDKMTGNGDKKGPGDLGELEEIQDLAETDEELDDELCTELDDITRAELEELVGVKVVGLDVWEESLSDGEDEEPVPAEERIFFDCDLLLEDGSALELYAAAVYPDPDGDPIKGMEQISQAVEKLAEQKLELVDFDQADEEGGLALAFGVGERTDVVIAVSAWLVSEWEEDDEEGEEDQEEDGEDGEEDEEVEEEDEEEAKKG